MVDSPCSSRSSMSNARACAAASAQSSHRPLPRDCPGACAAPGPACGVDEAAAPSACRPSSQLRRRTELCDAPPTSPIAFFSSAASRV